MFFCGVKGKNLFIEYENFSFISIIGIHDKVVKLNLINFENNKINKRL